ncbi:MAG: glutamate--tRNA ligase [Firmicutes bacterium]|nr:glutamate--tRNA ligase [Bacillota bacterium]
MDYRKLAELVFPEIDKTPDDYELIYPERSLPEGAKVTRLAPSPTGFIHLGNLFGALVDERAAHQSGGVCVLRIEDTDVKREVEGAIPVLINTLDYFGIRFDEGAMPDGWKGEYGPYWQSERGYIYKACCKKLISEGKAYPCFMSEEEIQQIRAEQEKNKINPGIYGEYARHRDLSYEEVERRLAEGQKPVIRLRSWGDPSRYFKVNDAIRGEISMPENIQDVVILKTIGLPTYHFAHVVDDHFMRISHVVRGEEWMPSLPIHVQLFEAMGWEHPVYCHNTVLMKVDEQTGQKRKLSKRKDPELSLEFYMKLGYFPEAVREYLLTILNSDFEEWRMAHPNADMDEFEFGLSKMSSSGTFFDISKLNDVSKDVLARKSAEEIRDFMLGWAEQHHPDIHELFEREKDKLVKIFDIDRGGEKPRKDLIYAEQIFDFIKYFFDEYFEYESEWPAECEADRKEILRRYLEGYDISDDNDVWFGKVRAIAEELGYAAKPKDYKKNPDAYKGHVGHVSSVIRIAVTGRSSSPDLCTIQKIMGIEQVTRRIERAMDI